MKNEINLKSAKLETLLKFYFVEERATGERAERKMKEIKTEIKNRGYNFEAVYSSHYKVCEDYYKKWYS